MYLIALIIHHVKWVINYWTRELILRLYKQNLNFIYEARDINLDINILFVIKARVELCEHVCYIFEIIIRKWNIREYDFRVAWFENSRSDRIIINFIKHENTLRDNEFQIFSEFSLQFSYTCTILIFLFQYYCYILLRIIIVYLFYRLKLKFYKTK